MPDAPEPLPEGSVHVWRVELDLALRDWRAMARDLDPQERARAERFRFDEDRARFLGSHAALRRILALYEGCDPAEIRFCVGPHGRPELESSAGGLRFNLSHSGELALVAVARGWQVGVDVERILPKPDLMQVARKFFSPSEVQALESVDAGRRLRALYACWTRKEAWLKAHGVGLGLPLACFSVDVDPDVERPSVSVKDGDLDKLELRSLALGEGYAGAVAAPAAVWDGRVTCRCFGR